MSENATPEQYISGLEQMPGTVDEALHATVTAMLAGARIQTPKDTSYEVLHYRTGMTNARARICVKRQLNIVGAVARLVWMIAGSNRLRDIAFYEPKVAGYTDDQLSVPGSSYGKRLFDAAPGLDQIRGVIARLEADSYTRQAAAVVWVPEDAVRKSNDIPCTFGMFFHIRDRQLIMRTVMRSNHAFRLMSYNFFEFSMLGEIVAATLGIEMGPYLHDAASMHVYADNFEWGPTQAVADGAPGQSLEMPAMPRPSGDRSAINQARELARLEALLRHSYTHEEFASTRESARQGLDDYWLNLFNVLAAWGAAARGWADLVDELVAALPPYFASSVSGKAAERLAEATPETAEATGADTVEHNDGMLPLGVDVPALAPVEHASSVADAREQAARDAAIIALMEIQLANPTRFDRHEVPAIADILLADQGVMTSARSSDPDAALAFDDAAIDAAIAELRRR